MKKIKNLLKKGIFEKLSYSILESKNKRMKDSNYEKNLKKWYKSVIGKELNLEKPKIFTEKLQWLKLYNSTPLKTKLADKYKVREWITDKIGEEYLIPLLGVWDNANDIDFNLLPNKFILKANHGCGWNIIVKDKKNINEKKVRKDLNKWLSFNYGYRNGFELQYRNIEPKIIAEAFIEEKDKSDLRDYKIHCFNGKPEIIEIILNRASKNNKFDLYLDKKWELLPIDVFTEGGWNNQPYKHISEEEKNLLKPKNNEKLIELASILSEGFPYVRVDFYNIEGKIYFGEMTFTPAGGADPIGTEEWLTKLGDLIELPKEKIPFPH